MDSSSKSRSKPPSSQSAYDLRRVLEVAHLHLAGRSQKEISAQLGLKKTAVSRYVHLSQQYLKISVEVPGIEQFERQLLERYQSLQDVRVVEAGLDDFALKVVSETAARYLLEHLNPRDSIALSCGSTLLKVLMALPSALEHSLDITQLSVEADPGAIHEAPATLLGILRAKTAGGGECFGWHLPPIDDPNLPEHLSIAVKDLRKQLANSALVDYLRNRALSARLLLLGIGSAITPPGKRPYAFHRLARKVAKRRYEQYAENLGLVGEINNQVFDRNGRDCTAQIPGLSERFINVLDLQDISRMAAEPLKHKVIAVATGAHKARAIHVAATVGLINVLIIARADAERLLEFKEGL